MLSSKMRRYLPFAVAVIIILLGLGVRLFDLTDQPIDFHSTRQLRGAMVARGLYYEMLPDADPFVRSEAIGFGRTTGQYEPPILEKIVAYAYLLMGGETLWYSRIFTILFWVIGGVALFDLARRMTSMGGALVAVAYYLLLPFAVQASRSFQPDPGMVMWIILCVYALYRWGGKQTWKWAILAGIFGGIAILTKVVAGYIVGGAAIAIVLNTLGFRRFWRSLQVWAAMVLMLAPSVIYYLNRGERASDYFAGWTLSLSHLLRDPSFYVRWLNMVQNLMGLTVLLLALVGVLISSKGNKALLVGLWLGYIFYGLFLPYQMYTHSYYHLQLVPIIALSLAPLVEPIRERLSQQEGIWQALFVGVVLISLIFPLVVSVGELKRVDYRNEPGYWQEIAAKLPTDGKIIALTQDYGYRLSYYGWRKVQLWPNSGELKLSDLRGVSKEFEELFAKRTEGKSYFLITAMGQFNNQPALKQYLNERYPLSAEGDGYLIYDLLNPKE